MYFDHAHTQLIYKHDFCFLVYTIGIDSFKGYWFHINRDINQMIIVMLKR